MKLIKCLLAVAVFTMSLGAHAEWLCTYRNAENQKWMAYGQTCNEAYKKAKNLCYQNSCLNTCVLKDCIRR